MNKTDLIQKIKQLEGITLDERSYLINLVNTKKKYGLVWEDKPEDVEEQLRTQLPVLREVVEKRIMSEPGTKKSEPGFIGLKDGQDSKKSKTLQTSLFDELEEQDNPENQINPKNHSSDSFPNHILIEGDNLHALTALTFTHEGKIDVIYIDPPYNTGNKDFKYNDSFVDREDSYRHSKWLSFMDKRLRIAKSLLSEKGAIFISIDDNEQAQLKILCDEILGTENFISNIANINNPKGRSDDKYIATAHEYILIYRKTNQLKMGGFEPDEKITKRYTKSDNNGIYRDIDLRKTGDGDTRQDRPNMFYPFYYNSVNGDFFATDIEDVMPEGYVSILPMKSSTMEGRWRWGLENSKANTSKLVPKYMPAKKQWTVFEKDYLEKRDSIKSTSVWDFKDVNSERGTELFIKDLGFEKGSFQNPKPIGTLNRILKISTNKTAIILDFFAGSGTTLHATMQLNAEDGGNRQCILVTNNENNICEEVTYQRNRRVIQGYSKGNGELVSGLTNNNLRYYKSEFVSREPSLKNKRELTRLATELLCIKEDCYEEKTLDIEITNKEDLKNIRFFEENDKRILVVYDDEAIETSVEIIKSIISKNTVPENGIKVYVFSPGQYPFTEEFEDVLPYITLCALPDAIYKAFINVLPKKIRPSIPEIEDEAIDNQPGLIE